MKEVKELIELKGTNVKVLSIEEKVENNEKIKIISFQGTVSKIKCPKCDRYTKSVMIDYH